MTISKIDGKKVQQHFELLYGDTDSYLECEFSNESSVLRLNVGQMISVYGVLSEAFDKRRFRPDSKAVKLRDCEVGSF